MTAAVPQLKLNEIADEINLLLRSGVVHEFKLKQIERELATLVKANAIPPFAYQMYMALHALAAGNRSSAESRIANAIALKPADKSVILNAIMIYGAYCNITACLPLINMAADRWPDDKHVLSQALIGAHGLLQFSVVNSLLGRIDKLSINDADDLTARKRHLMAIMEVGAGFGFSDEEYGARLTVAAEALRASGMDVIRTSYLAIEDGTFVFHLHVNASQEQCAQGNFVIADALVENFDDTAADFFSMVCRPLSDVGHITHTEAI